MHAQRYTEAATTTTMPPPRLPKKNSPLRSPQEKRKEVEEYFPLFPQIEIKNPPILSICKRNPNLPHCAFVSRLATAKFKEPKKTATLSLLPFLPLPQFDL